MEDTQTINPQNPTTEEQTPATEVPAEEQTPATEVPAEEQTPAEQPAA